MNYKLESKASELVADRENHRLVRGVLVLLVGGTPLLCIFVLGISALKLRKAANGNMFLAEIQRCRIVLPTLKCTSNENRSVPHYHLLHLHLLALPSLHRTVIQA